MLEWFNAFLTLFGEFVALLFRLPFYGNISFGYLLVAMNMLIVLIWVFFVKIK